MAGVRVGMTTLELDVPAALAAARALGAGGWSVAEMLASVREGMLTGLQARRAQTVNQEDTVHG